MTVERMLELIILEKICENYGNDEVYANFLDENYDLQKLGVRCEKLGKEFLNDYALNKTEKSD